MPEYIVGLVSCICKNPNVKSRFWMLSRSSKITGLMTYSPELGIFVYSYTTKSNCTNIINLNENMKTYRLGKRSLTAMTSMNTSSGAIVISL